YDSVAKLAAAGVVDGYADGAFDGDKLMTRYEMAQIVAKAMAKGADCDKLAAEFADELDTLGVRVAKLEKGADAVKITGQVRYRYMNSDDKADDNQLRTRLWINGQVNDDWSYTAMLQHTDVYDDADDEESNINFQRAYVQGKLGGLDVTAGRYNAYFGDGYVYDTRADAIEASYGLGAVKVTGFVGKGTDAGYGPFGSQAGNFMGNYAGFEATTEVAGLNVMAGYANFKDLAVNNSGIDNGIWWAQVAKTMGDVSLKATYLKGDASGNAQYEALDDDGYAFAVAYKGAKASEVGSWGLLAQYWNQGGQTYIAHTTDAAIFDHEGFKGYGLQATYTLAKNIVLDVAWYDTESKSSNDEDQRLYADVYFTF
ncbi:MAG: S-layer homology domain-containing protein, partial [Phascolarctobacterium sp.]|nr:S-layer homology domain-containing protein [Phascolarctobacterium sp.]